MLFKTRYNKVSEKMALSLNSQLIENVPEFKYLGITLNESLNYEQHYETVCKGMTSRMYMLNRQKKTLHRNGEITLQLH